MTSAVAFRLIEKHEPTILADEYDGWLKDNQELSSLLNSGYKRGTWASRCEGDKNEVRLFKCYSPAVLCGIGHLPGTLHDRSIVIRLTRAKPGEVSAQFDPDCATKEVELNRKLARWVADNRQRIEAANPKLPSGAFNRLGEKWRPLFAIAEIIGGTWQQRCAEAFSKLTTQGMEVESYRVMVLADINPMVQEAIGNGSEWLLSSDIIDALVSNPERPWNTANRGKPINEHWLGRRLDPIKPGRFRALRDGKEKQSRGYKVADLQDAIDRFLAPTDLSGQASQHEGNSPSQVSQQASQGDTEGYDV
jgi:hypothetical protein